MRSSRHSRPARDWHPVLVPGWHWLAATVTGWRGPALLACCRWWSPRAPGDPEDAPAAHQQTAGQIQLVQDLARRWGARVLFVLDRGFASIPAAGRGRRTPHRRLASPARPVPLNLSSGVFHGSCQGVDVVEMGES